MTANDPHSPSDVLKLIRDQDVNMVDVRFIDLVGAWQHFSVPARQIDENVFERGFGFDGSSIRGWQAIGRSDILVVPEASTARVDPFMEVPTLALLADVRDPATYQGHERDARSLAKRAEAHLRATGVADTSFFGPEAQFFIFDDVRYANGPNESFYRVDSVLGHWNSGREEFPNLGYKIRANGGCAPLPPADSHQDLRSAMVLALEQVGIVVERQHMEAASGGQAEIDIRFDSLVSQADKLCWLKYVIKNVARKHGKTATFMPKPIYGDHGNGMHTNVSLWREGKALFAGDEYSGLSALALHFIAGVLHHAPALCALTNPSTNSYKRLVPVRGGGCEAPVKLAYASRSRSTSVRVPPHASSPNAARMEFRTPDASCNPYLAFAALLMAGLDGVERRLDPGQALDDDGDGTSPEQPRELAIVPGTLEQALEALERDHGFLLRGDVFNRELLFAWIDWKRKNEVDQVRTRPHPYELALYFDT